MFKLKSSRGTLPMQWMMASTIPWCRSLLVWVLSKMHRSVKKNFSDDKKSHTKKNNNRLVS